MRPAELSPPPSPSLSAIAAAVTAHSVVLRFSWRFSSAAGTRCASLESEKSVGIDAVRRARTGGIAGVVLLGPSLLEESWMRPHD